MEMVEGNRGGLKADSGSETSRLERTLQAARLLQSTLNLKELTAIILDIVRNEVPVDRVTAFVIDRDRNVVSSLVAQGVQDFTIEVPIGSGIAGTVAETQQILDIPDAYADTRFNSEVDRELKYRTSDILALPVLNKDGAPVGVLELINRKQPISEDDRDFLRDISVFIGLALDNARMYDRVESQVRLEEELARSRERLAQLDRIVLFSEVLSAIGIELDSPLSIVLSQTALVKQDRYATPEMVRRLDVVEAAANRSKSAIGTFLSFVQTEKGQRSLVDGTDLVRQTVALRASHWASHEIELEEHLEDTPPVQADRAGIEQALMNVFKNAEDAMVENQTPKRLIVSTAHDQAHNRLRITVEDNGAGIPVQLYEKVFEPFFSTKRHMGRAGLGLTIAGRIIQEHGGEILFDSEPGRTLFTIELPV